MSRVEVLLVVSNRGGIRADRPLFRLVADNRIAGGGDICNHAVASWE